MQKISNNQLHVGSHWDQYLFTIFHLNNQSKLKTTKPSDTFPYFWLFGVNRLSPKQPDFYLQDSPSDALNLSFTTTYRYVEKYSSTSSFWRHQDHSPYSQPNIRSTEIRNLSDKANPTSACSSASAMHWNPFFGGSLRTQFLSEKQQDQSLRLRC